MKHKVAELEGALLDAAVANAEGLEVEWKTSYPPFPVAPRFCSDWTLGGPIIERERINLYAPLCVGDDELWQASFGGRDSLPGSTPLVAAMRAYVDSRFGDVVELP